jgi:His-Xaa-Ser system protein HxsD
MSTIEVRFDSVLFSSEAVTAAAHRYTNDYFVQIERGISHLIVRLNPRGDGVNASQVAEHLRNSVLDEQLRAHIRRETSELHAILVEAALRPAHSKAEQEP